MTAQRCKCPECNCNYKLEGYTESEDVCGACLDNCLSETCAQYRSEDKTAWKSQTR